MKSVFHGQFFLREGDFVFGTLYFLCASAYVAYYENLSYASAKKRQGGAKESVDRKVLPEIEAFKQKKRIPTKSDKSTRKT